MAIIECYECGKDISDKAASCPHCGAPSKTLTTNPEPVTIPIYEQEAVSEPTVGDGVMVHGTGSSDFSCPSCGSNNVIKLSLYEQREKRRSSGCLGCLLAFLIVVILFLIFFGTVGLGMCGLLVGAGAGFSLFKIIPFAVEYWWFVLILLAIWIAAAVAKSRRFICERCGYQFVPGTHRVTSWLRKDNRPLMSIILSGLGFLVILICALFFYKLFAVFMGVVLAVFGIVFAAVSSYVEKTDRKQSIVGGSIGITAIVFFLLLYILRPYDTVDSVDVSDTGQGPLSDSTTPEHSDQSRASQQARPKTVLINDLIAEITASSFHPRHPPEHVNDKDGSTAWNDKAGGSGEGSWLEIVFKEAVSIHHVTISNGYQKVSKTTGKDLFFQNSRLKKVVILADGRELEQYDIKEDTRTVEIVMPTNTTQKIRIVAKEVWPGTKWKDLCISEIAFYSEHSIEQGVSLDIPEVSSPSKKKARILLNKGRKLVKFESEYMKALDLYKTAAANDPKSAWVWEEMSYVLNKLGQHEEALLAAKKAIALSDNWKLLGAAYLDLLHA